MIRKVLHYYRRKFWPTIKYAKYIGVNVGQGCVLGKIDFGTEPYLITIGNRVQITDDVKFFNHGGAWVFRSRNPEFDFFGKISIGNNVYVGNNVLIMPGVTIGNDIIIGAGSVVTKSLDSGFVFAGNPAKKICSIFEMEIKIQPYNVNTKNKNAAEKKEILLRLNNSIFIKK
jgi:acetyltransferase-like isoleucine patch superfamily enzyme